MFKKIIDEKQNYFPITHRNMTRFIITLDEGIDFVIKSFERMYGGEIFIPKIKSLKILDLAETMDKKKRIKYSLKKLHQKSEIRFGLERESTPPAPPPQFYVF